MSLKSYIQALLNTRTTKAEAGSASMPSGTSISVTLDWVIDGSNEEYDDMYKATYTAPKDGWIRVTGYCSGESMLNVSCNFVTAFVRYVDSGATLAGSVPCKKGASVTIWKRNLDIAHIRFTCINGAV